MFHFKAMTLLIALYNLVIAIEDNKNKSINTELLYNAIQNYDELCIICIKNLCTKKYDQLNETEWKHHLSSNKRILFPYCHGYYFCDDCIYDICSHSTKLRRICPYCRRNTISMFNNNKSHNERIQVQPQDNNNIHVDEYFIIGILLVLMALVYFIIPFMMVKRSEI